MLRVQVSWAALKKVGKMPIKIVKPLVVVDRLQVLLKKSGIAIESPHPIKVTDIATGESCFLQTIIPEVS